MYSHLSSSMNFTPSALKPKSEYTDEELYNMNTHDFIIAKSKERIKYQLRLNVGHFAFNY